MSAGETPPRDKSDPHRIVVNILQILALDDRFYVAQRNKPWRASTVEEVLELVRRASLEA